MTSAADRQDGPRVAIVGGGLAGLAAAAALCEEGFGVELFEARRRLGGRAASFRDPESGELVDHCQHVAMACCTNLADFCRRTGVADCFQRRRRLHFIGPGRARCVFSAAPLLPAPLHLAPALMRLGYLRLSERADIVRALMRLASPRAGREDDATTIGAWLRAQGQSDRALERFWSPILVSALSETLDRASLSAARKVFVEGFLASRQAYELRVPRVPLDEIYDRRVADWLTARDVVLHRGTAVQRIEGTVHRAEAVVPADGSRRPFDFFVVAVPWRAVRALFTGTLLEALPGLKGVERFEPTPITAVHLWFDRPITPLTDAVLVGRLSQWLFNRGRQADGANKAPMGHYYQVVISASYGLRGRRRENVVAQVREELAAIWPAAGDARLLRWRIVTNRGAVFSPRPGIDRFRPAQQTPVPNLMLAGDWTATGWPATMEGAVRSGYLAAEAVLGRQVPETPKRFLLPGLPWGRLARWMIGSP